MLQEQFSQSHHLSVPLKLALAFPISVFGMFALAECKYGLRIFDLQAKR